MAKTVIILGGAYGGLHIAHYLLKNDTDVKVVLVSKNSHFYWNIAAVRAIVPGVLKPEEYFVSLKEALGRYPGERAEVLIGTARAVDPTAKTVKIDIAGVERELAYDQLVVATGSRCTPPSEAASAGALIPWKADGSYEEVTALLESIKQKVTAAKHIVVAGGGSTGAEAAAELGYEYGGRPEDKGGKQVVLLSSSSALLGGDSIAGSVTKELEKLHVDVRTNTSVTASKVLPDGRIELTVSGASEPVVTDVYLASYGLIPNTEFLPGHLLTDRKTVKIDSFYRLDGADTIWAVGDVVSQPKPSYFFTQKQAAAVGKNLVLVLSGSQPQPVKLPNVDILVLSTGRSRGVGRFGAIPIPSFAVYYAKGKTLGTQAVPKYLDGRIA